jgi:putative acetyltransferase
MNYQIRHATPADYEAVTRVFSGPKAVWGTFQLPYPSPELWRKRVSELEAGVYLLVACHESDLVGMLGLHTQPNMPRRRHSADLGMAVRDDWQGKGVGTALMKAAVDLADNWLNLERLALHVYIDNEAGVRLYRKFGFETEGTLRRFAFRDGQFVDAYVMSRLRPASIRSPA